MKKISIILSIVIVGALFSSASLLKTQLQVTVFDDIHNFQEGAVVKLYLTQKDYDADKPVMDAQKTDKKGRTKFVGLEPVNYFILVKKGNKDNVLNGERTGELVEGKINKVNIEISE